LLLIAGDHEPLIPFVDNAGNVNVPPAQIGATCVNAGKTFGLTVTVIAVVLAHCPAAGVNEYVVVALLLIAGDQVPVIPFVEVADNVNEPPEHIEAT
jgi:hypothetical protein